MMMMMIDSVGLFCSFSMMSDFFWNFVSFLRSAVCRNWTRTASAYGRHITRVHNYCTAQCHTLLYSIDEVYEVHHHDCYRVFLAFYCRCAYVVPCLELEDFLVGMAHFLIAELVTIELCIPPDSCTVPVQCVVAQHEKRQKMVIHSIGC